MTNTIQNQNVYLCDGLYRVRTIRECECFKKIGQRYYARCRIQRRKDSPLNAPDYVYYSDAGNGSGLLLAEGRRGPRFALYTDPKARETVSEAGKTFEYKIAAARAWPSFGFEFSGSFFTLYYRHLEAELFDFMLDVKAGEETVALYERVTVKDPIKTITGLVSEYERGKAPEEIDTSGKALQEVLCAAAGEGGNGQIALLIRHHYRCTDESDVPALEKLFGGRVLPPLSNKFDRYFAVNTASVDFELLRRSGYQFLHRPYFAMRGCTRQKCKLNPARRFGVDFGENDEETIDFDGFLKMFDQARSLDLTC